MATEFHVRVGDVLAAAIRTRTADRDSFIDRAANGDYALTSEVKSLLPHYLKVNGFEPDLPGLFDSQSQASLGAALAYRDDDDWDVPFAIAPYQVVGLIGRGGMGVVYKGVHSTRPQEVAIKVLRRRFVHHGLIRFKQEEALLRRLQNPGIVRFLYCGETVMRRGPRLSEADRRPYFVMELIHGQSLLKYANAARLNATARLALLVRICDALEYAHHHGVVHCDLKPDNILVDVHGQPKILDFGIARLQQFGLPIQRNSKAFVGTLAYASPEQRAACGRVLSPESDVYSLGLLMHELLTGRLPRRVGSRLVLDIKSVTSSSPPAANPGNDQWFQHVCHGILAKALRGTHGRRYATAGELGKDLNEVYRMFAPPPRGRISAWLSAWRRDTPSSPTGHSRLLCALLRTRIGMGFDK